MQPETVTLSDIHLWLSLVGSPYWSLNLSPCLMKTTVFRVPNDFFGHLLSKIAQCVPDLNDILVADTDA